MIIDELIAVLGYETRGEGELRRFEKNLDGATKNISALGVAAGTFVGTIAAQAFSRLADAVTSLPGDVIKTTAQFESLEASLTTVTGSVDQAKAAMDWISKFAATTPYEINGITEAFIKLKSYGIDPLADDALKTLGDTASAMNKPLNQAVEALADATSFEFERLKEFGLRAQQKGNEVTFTWTKNGKEMTKTIKKNSEEVRKFILDQLGDRFNGAMVRQSKTWNGMMSNLGDSWTAFLLKIGRGGFFDAVKGRLSQLLDYFGRLADDGTLDRWGRSLSRIFEATADAVSNFAVRMGRHFGTISDLIERNKGVFDTLKWALLGLAAYLFPVVTMISLAALAIDDFLTYMRGGDSVIGSFVESLSKLLGSDPKAVAEALGTLALAAGGLGAASLAIGGFTASLWPLAAALGAVGGAYLLAKAFFDNMDQEVAKIKTVSNPRNKPGYVEGSGEDRTGFNSNNPNGYLGGSDYGPGFLDAKARLEAEEARRLGLGSGAKRKPSAYERLGGDYIRSDLMDNATGNFGKLGAANAAASVENTVNNDNSGDRSVNVTVNQTVQQASQAPGAAAQATANAVAGAGATSHAARLEKSSAF